MLMRKRTYVGAILAAVVAAAMVNPGSALAASDTGGGKDATRSAAVPRDASLAPDRAAHGVAVSAASIAALAAVQARIANYVATHGTAYTFGSYLDGTTGKMVLETDAPAAVVDSLTRLSGAAGVSADVAQMASAVQVRHNTVSDAFHRRDDVPAFWGGAGLQGEGFLCSAGYAVTVGGANRMVTAGHCFNNGATVLTESGANTFGTVSNRLLPTITGGARDMELIGGSSYAGRVYTGGVTSTTSGPVVAAGAASVGFTNYCTSGRTTGETCGHTATSVTGQVCTTTGCKSPVIVYNGGTLPAGGDSGGSFYAKDAAGGIFIRGHHIAGGGATSYAEPWLETQAAYGAVIVLG
jgi:hypothetical protein